MASQTSRLEFPCLQLIFTTLGIILPVVIASTNPHYIVPERTPVDCMSEKEDVYHEFFNIANLSCIACAQNSTIQTVTSDGLQCKCRDTYKLTKDLGGSQITCESCPGSMVASSDGCDCVTCSVPQPPTEPEVPCAWCEAPDVTVERDLDGSFLTNTNTSGPERTCVTCEDTTTPDDHLARCTRCNLELRFQATCDCPQDRLTGGLCFPDVSRLEPDYPQLYTVNFQSNSEFPSDYFKENLRAAHGACAAPWSNLTACQQVANLCVLLLYDLTNTPPSGKVCGAGGTPCNDACSLYLRLGEPLPGNKLPSHNVSHPRIPYWRVNMAWLFYPPNSQSDLRKDSSIPTSFTKGSLLNFTVAMYDVSGSFLGYTDQWQDQITYCTTSSQEPVQFGVQFKKECYLHVDGLLNSTQDTRFYELNMPYMVNKDRLLYAIPILVRNLKDKDGNTPNKDSDAMKWQFVRRFFLTDTVSGRSVSDPSGPPAVVRYLKTARLYVSLRDGDVEGRIYVPWLELEYGEVTSSQYGQGEQVPVTFEVVYSMDLTKHQTDLSIAIGVLSGLALLYSAFQTYNYNRRHGRIAIECSSLAYLALHLAGTLSNVFFAVITGASIWWFLLYKLQDTMLLIPTLDGDYFIRAFLGSAFALKAIHIIYLIIAQCTVDLFFVDWERPQNPPVSQDSNTKPGETKVSIWRTYFVANEWNELSTMRSINMAALLLLVTLLLKGVGLENLAKLEPGSRLASDGQGEDVVEFSRTLRFALSAMVYIGIAVIIWLLHHLVYKTLVTDRLGAFGDLCSMCNISTFIMTHEQYGYYVHGRGVHGRTDVGLREMHVNLNREQDNLCGERGLDPGTDHQTFEIALPRLLRTEYNKVLQPLQRARARLRLRNDLGEERETKLQAYVVLNKFLQNFLDHNLTNLDYLITQKNLFERILDTEREDNRDLGYFYVDQGHSFDQTLLYGHEMTLQVFFLLFFTMVDLIGTNFVLAATLTFIMNEVICRARYALGRRNIAAKTMVDLRLLI